MLDIKDFLISFNSDVCLSGGADGADLQWGMTAGMAGHSVIHWSFLEHNSNAPESELVRLTCESLEEAAPFVKQAAMNLNRSVPYKSYIKKLIYRNYFQIRDSSSLYGVGFIENNQVQGGTAWAIEMFKERLRNNSSLKMYFFDQNSNSWYEYLILFGWSKIEKPPKPSGIWAGIGSRDLKENGKNAIRTLMDWQKP